MIYTSVVVEVDLVVGTPPQRVSVILDTGSGVGVLIVGCWSDLRISKKVPQSRHQLFFQLFLQLGRT